MATKIRRDTSLPTTLSAKIGGFSEIYTGSYKYVVETVGGVTQSAAPRINPTIKLSDHSHSLSILAGYHKWDGLGGIACPAANHKIRLDYHDDIAAIVSANFAMTRSHYPQTGSATGTLNVNIGSGTIEIDSEGSNTFTEFDGGGPGVDLFHFYEWSQRVQTNPVESQAVVHDLFLDAAGGFYYPTSCGVDFSASIAFSDGVTTQSSIDSTYGFPTYDDGTPQYPFPGQQFPDKNPVSYSGGFSINPNTDETENLGPTGDDSVGVRISYFSQIYATGDPDPTPHTFGEGDFEIANPHAQGVEGHNVTTGGVSMAYTVPDTGFSDFVAIDSTANTYVNAHPPFSGAICALGTIFNCT